MKMETRGTQTDLVTDRNIADCLMELKSSAEFQDLTYRLSRSCTGEMTLTITRDSSVGLLGGPFDPVFVTVTASGLCYFSVVFTPVEVTNLKPNGDLNLRKFRHILWKLNGRAGYGFCPGFKESDFPESFKFEDHELEVLKQPFTRVQAKECRVFQQLRRSSSRAISQPLGLQLCSRCLKALADVYASLKKSGQDLSKCPAFAKFLPSQSHPTALNNGLHQENSRLKESDEQSEYCGKANLLVPEEDSVGAGSNLGVDNPSLCVASECEVVTENSTQKSRPVKSSSSKPPVKDCSVLLNRFIPEAGHLYKSESKSKMVVANGAVSSDSSPVASPATRPHEHSSSAALCPPEHSQSSSSSFSASSSVSWPLNSPSSSTGASNGSTLQQKQTSSENFSSRPVLSARIKPFRTVTPHRQETTELGLTDSAETEVALAAVSETSAPREVKMEMDPPPVLSPEFLASPVDSPQPLCIDEDADPDQLETASEPDAKRPCYRCSLCEEGFQSDTELRQHFSQQHTQSTAPGDQSESLASSDLITDEAEELEPELPRWKVCPVCRNSFSTKEQLEAHLTDRHRARLHRCRYCGQKFALKKNLADHLERHRGSKRLACKECGNTFSKKKDFAAHVREHMGSLPYFCTICSRLFSRESVYKEHMERHRTKRGVRAVLSGSEMTLQGIKTKAKKCLEEKALLMPAATVTTSEAKLVSQVTDSSATDSLSTSTPQSATSPPSNLHLLSVVSLAQAELEKSSRPPSAEEKMSSDAMESTAAAAQLIHMPSGETNKAESLSPNSASSASSGPEENIEDTKNIAVPEKLWPEESNALLQKLNAPLKLSKSPPLDHSEQQQEQTHSAVADKESGSAPDRPGLSAEVDVSQQGTASEPVSEPEELRSGSSKERLLAEREEKLKQKERELREREQDITRKNMLFFQQLLVAQLSQQPKNGSGSPATSSEQKKGDKPISPQALAMMAALNGTAGRGIGRGAIPMLRPPFPGTELRPGKALPNFLGSKLPFPVPAEMGGKRPRQGLEPASGVVPETSRSSAGVTPPGPSPPPHASTSIPRPSAIPPKQDPLNLTSPRLPPPFPIPSGARMPHRSPAVSPRSPSSSTQQPGKQALSPRRDSFLDMLMSMQSKMPESVKQFLPPPLPKARPAKPAQPTLPSSKSPGVILHSETPESMARAIGNKAKGERWLKPKGPELRKKQSRWSGGLVKEQLNSVVTVVPPQEMKRLLSLNKSFSPIPTPTSEAAAPSNSSAGLASPPAHSPLSSRTAGSSRQPSPAAPSPLSSTHTTGGPPSAASASSPASRSSSPPPSHSPNPIPKSMPSLVPASDLVAVSSQIMPWLPKNPPQSPSEEAGPIDLTKASSSRKAAAEKRSEKNKPEGEDPQSVVLRHILLDPPVSQNQPPGARHSVASGRSRVPDKPGPDFVPPRALNPQAAALQARLHAHIQARSKGNSLLQPFFPGMMAQPVLPPPPPGQGSGAPSVSEAAQVRSGQRLAYPVLTPQGMMLPGGRIPPPQGLHSPPERAQLLAPPFMAGGPVGSPVGFVPTPSSTRQSPSSSAGSTGLVTSSLALPPGVVLVPSAAAVSSQPGSLPATVSSPSPLLSPPQTMVSPPHSSIPNFLIPESDSMALGPVHGAAEKGEHKPAVNPLGGFAWHRPATVDPFLAEKKSTTSHKDPDQEGKLEGGREKNTTEEGDADMTEDQNLWQQQFLQTLREKRRQQQEQQQRQRQRQQFLATNHLLPNNAAPPAKRGRRRKKNSPQEAETMELDGIEYTTGINLQHPSIAGVSTTDIIASQAQHAGANTAKRSRGKSGRGRPRGRPRKNAPRPTVVEPPMEQARVETATEEGAEFQGFGPGVEVKVEPLEAGVTCDACNKVLYSENEILEHNCDSQ